VLLVMIGVAGWLVASEFKAMMLDRVERKRATPTEPDDA
jgi:hypothetical protein